jgi:hypothetical protein
MAKNSRKRSTTRRKRTIRRTTRRKSVRRTKKGSSRKRSLKYKGGANVVDEETKKKEFNKTHIYSMAAIQQEISGYEREIKNYRTYDYNRMFDEKQLVDLENKLRITLNNFKEELKNEITNFCKLNNK